MRLLTGPHFEGRKAISQEFLHTRLWKTMIPTPLTVLVIVSMFMVGCTSAPNVSIQSDQRLITIQDIEQLSLESPESLFPSPLNGTDDEGGIANVTDLEQDMRDILINWNQAASIGVTRFATTELSRRVDQVESGDWTETIMGFIGNTIWAGTVFLTASSATIFGVSMAAILIETAPVIPSEVQSTVPKIHEQMINYMQSIYDQLNKQLRNRAQLLIDSHPGITRYRALTIFVQQSFKAGLYRFDPTYRTPPTLNKQAIMRIYENWPLAAVRVPAELMLSVNSSLE